MSEVEFKVGDKVRLVGSEWPSRLGGREVRICSADDEGFYFEEAAGTSWCVEPDPADDFGAELVKPYRSLAEKRQDDFEVLEKASRPWREAPDYYKFPNGVQTTDISMHLNSNGGQAVGYISRSTRIDGKNKETDPRESLQKAIDLLKMELYRLDQELGGSN